MNITNHVARHVRTIVLNVIKFVFLAAPQAAFVIMDIFEMEQEMSMDLENVFL